MNTAGKKTLAILEIGVGVVAIITAIYLAVTGSEYSMRGAILIGGLLLIILGAYTMPTKKRRNVINVLFLLPLVLTFAVTVLIPFILGIFYSFTDWTGIEFTKFVGFENYITMFKASDFLYSFMITFVFTLFNMFLVNLVAFGLAILCTSQIKGRDFYRAAFFLPNLIGGLVLGYVWQFIFNKVFTAIVPGSLSMLTNPNLALLAILVVSTWQYSGYIMMIYVTGIQSIPKDVLEASSVDGAGKWATLLKIKLPMMANTFTVCVFLTLVNSFKQFDLNLAITNGAPSRILGEKVMLSTEFMALNIYRTAIAKNQYALGQTKAVVFFVVLAIVSLTQVSISKKREVEI